MRSDLPKVLHEVCGLPMLKHVLTACRLAGVDRLIVVVGHGMDELIRQFESDRDLTWIEQPEQKGTGDAVLCARDVLRDFTGSVLVIAGDMPLVRREALAGLLEAREQNGAAATLATAVLDDPSGYGRIIRDERGELLAIVEECDCTAAQRDVCEINPSYYCFDAKAVFEALEQVKPVGPKGEHYLTEAIRILREAGRQVSACITVPSEDAVGVNSRLDLAAVGRVMQDRIQLGLMNEGVTIVDPDNTWIESDVSVGRDTVIYPFTMIKAGAIIGERCRIGPFVRVGVGEVLENGSAVGPAVCSGAATS
jgi:bifunctional UDP-N-acetylglucosamine pyrophosphorylase/glucosamine-1-phosphate N-acetyltransferase